MRVKLRWVLIWSSMFVLALVSGNMLGRYTAAGVRIPGVSADETALLEPADASPLTGRPLPAVSPTSAPAYVSAGPETHVCQGCDAGETRNRQLAQMLGLGYGAEDASTIAADEPDKGVNQPDVQQLALKLTPPVEPVKP